MEGKGNLIQCARRSREAARVLAGVASGIKNKALIHYADSLIRGKALLVRANKRDLESARRCGLSQAMLDRLLLDEKRIREMSDSLKAVARLHDPVGEVIKAWRRPNGLWIKKVRVPIGVIAVIYESRPNVTSDCIGLCFKSGNSVILRGGSEAIQTNTAIYRICQEAFRRFRLPEEVVQLITTTDRAAVKQLLTLNEYIDLVMPRGGEGLIRTVVAHSRIPVIKHYKGICHVYVDARADLKMAERICYNAKVQRPGVCNAMESMLVHRDVAQRFLPGMIRIFKAAGVEIRGCDLTRKMVKGIRAAREKDYRTEYLSLILSVKVVKSGEEAIRHINEYGSHHSDAIVTESRENAKTFTRAVDSACVYVNASTRFTDGYQFGMGAEIGISTDKLHARGPMALEELTTYKYIVSGSGQVRE